MIVTCIGGPLHGERVRIPPEVKIFRGDASRSHYVLLHKSAQDIAQRLLGRSVVVFGLSTLEQGKAKGLIEELADPSMVHPRSWKGHPLRPYKPVLQLRRNV